MKLSAAEKYEVEWIRSNLHTQPLWSKENYKEFYDKDVRFLLRLIDRLVKENQ